MKNMKKTLALALVIVSVLAIAIPALAANRPWENRWNLSTIFPDTFPHQSDEKYQQIKNIQGDLNTLRFKYVAFCTPSYTDYYFPQLVVDGQYGTNTTEAVKRVQRYFGLTVDGMFGLKTKDRVWNALGFTPYADSK